MSKYAMTGIGEKIIGPEYLNHIQEQLILKAMKAK